MKRLLICVLTACLCFGLASCGTQSVEQVCEQLRAELETIRHSDGTAYTWESGSDMGIPITIYTNGVEYYEVRYVDGIAVQEHLVRDGRLYNRLPMDETEFTDTGAEALDLPGLPELESLLSAQNFDRVEESKQAITLYVSEEYLQNAKSTIIANAEALLQGADPALLQETLQTLERLEYTSGTFTASLNDGHVTDYTWQLDSRLQDETGDIAEENSETLQLVLLGVNVPQVIQILESALEELG